MLAELLNLVRPLLLTLDAEQAHELTLRALEAGLHPQAGSAEDVRLAVSLWDLAFPNPVGVAAGFDKDGRVPDAVLDLGCGFAEAGTVTPRPQPGNPRPRVFRLISDRAVINRLGFNSSGRQAVLERLARRPKRGIVGVNIGTNKDTVDRAADYVEGLKTFCGTASYVAVNISSPSTPGLRDLQAPAALDALLGRLMAARALLAGQGRPHVLIVVKISPDIAEMDLGPITERLMAHGVDGIAVSNTTLSRTGVAGKARARESGGLSGRPLFHRSTVMLARVHQLTGGRVPLIGIGGIDSGAAALAKIEAGATLLQLYTGLVYEGPGLIGRIKEHLAAAVERAGLRSIHDLTGRAAADWAARPLDG